MKASWNLTAVVPVYLNQSLACRIENRNSFSIASVVGSYTKWNNADPRRRNTSANEKSAWSFSFLTFNINQAAPAFGKRWTRRSRVCEEFFKVGGAASGSSCTILLPCRFSRNILAQISAIYYTKEIMNLIFLCAFISISPYFLNAASVSKFNSESAAYCPPLALQSW